MPDHVVDRPEASRGILDALCIAAVGLLVFQLLRTWVGDRYVVPTGSMQPLLYGAADGGDVVYVDKLARAAGLQRYDCAVVVSPEDRSQHLVKRVVGLGDDENACCLELRGGDLWVGPTEQRLLRDQKNPWSARQLRATWFQWSASNPQPVDGFLFEREGVGREAVALGSCGEPSTIRRLLLPESRRLRADRGEPALPAPWIATLRAVDCSYVDVHGGRSREGERVQPLDVGMELHVPADGFRSLYLGVELRPHAWLIHLDVAAGEAELWCDGDTVRKAPIALPPGPSWRVEYGFLDGRFFLLLGDEVGSGVVFEPDRPVLGDAMPNAPWDGPRTRLFVGCRCDTADLLPVERLRIFRDVYWRRLPQVGGSKAARVVKLSRGCVYLLGDNSFDSRDSRMFGEVPLADFVGRPRYVIGPWPRWQSLGGGYSANR